MALCSGNLTKHINAYCGHNARGLYPTRGSRYIVDSMLRTLKVFGVAVSDDLNPNPTSLVHLNLSCPFSKLQILEYPPTPRYKYISNEMLYHEKLTL